MSAGCLDANQALDFVEGRMSAGDAALAEAHVADCSTCREVMAVAAGSVGIDETRATGPAPDRSPRTDAGPGTIVDRYRIGERLGRGGMGVVYRAHDPELGRSIALKLVRVISGRDHAAARTRLLREARALARLSHPNVVAVHDVGTSADDEVFIAMELVEGPTLRAWLAGGDRSPGEIIAAFVAAGRGLAAAHAAGLVHRDFKPDNVIVGADGRVRVLDFGLARTASELDDRTDAGAGRAEPDLTGTGHAVGTPAYMSPEQHLAGEVDAATDQFSFCVALHEALYQQRPFAGDDAESIRERVLAGDAEVPSRRDVPERVRAAIMRGLAPQRAARFPTIEALLEAIVPPARRPARIAALALAALAVAVIAAVAWIRASPAGPACDVGAERIAAAWNQARSDAVVTAFAATGKPHAASSARHVVTGLDAYARAWAAMHDAACTATHRNGEQSPRVLDLRMRCLDRRRRAAGRLVDRFVRADAAIVTASARAVDRLPAIADCADIEALERVVPLPDDPVVRARVEETEQQIDGIEALIAIGDYAAALRSAREVAATALEIGHAPLVAIALHARGRVERLTADHGAAEATLREAAIMAGTARDDDLGARIWIELIWVVGNRQRLAEALQLEGPAAAAVARTGDPLIRAAMLQNLASVRLIAGEVAPARAELDEALALRERALGRDHLEVAGTLHNLAAAQRIAGDSATAARTIARAIQICETRLGDRHPMVAAGLWLAATIHQDRVEPDRALALHARALAIREATLGAEHPLTLASRERVASLRADQGDDPSALSALETIVEAKRAKLGDDHLNVAVARIALGDALCDRGRHDRAIELYERAIATQTAILGPQHREIGLTVLRLARCLQTTGDPQRARPRYEQALPIVAAAGDARLIGAASFGLAQVLEESDPARARSLAVAARAAYAKLGPGLAADRAAIDAWLRTREP